MDYNKLYLFQVVSESASVTKAAKKMLRSQSAVTQQIQILEQELGVKLFRRRNAQIFLSPEGEALANTLGNHFTDIESGIRELLDKRERMAGKIRIGVLMDGSTLFELADEINKFSSEFPDVEFEVSFGTNESIEESLLSGRIDLAISILFKEKQNITQYPIWKSRHLLACHRALSAKFKRQNLSEIFEGSNIVDFNNDFMCLKPWLYKNAPSSVKVLNGLRPTLVVPSHYEASKFVKKGWGIAILPEHIITQNQPDIVPLRSSAEPLTVTLDVCHSAHRTPRRCEEKFIEQLVENGNAAETI